MKPPQSKLYAFSLSIIEKVELWLFCEQDAGKWD